MGFHVGAVDRDGTTDARLGGERFVDPLPDATPGPAIEAIVNGSGWTVFGGAVPPRAAGPQDMQNTADDPAVVDAAGARLVVGQQWLDD
jgi:hypothetical protein